MKKCPPDLTIYLDVRGSLTARQFCICPYSTFSRAANSKASTRAMETRSELNLP